MNGDGTDEVVHLLLGRVGAEHLVKGELHGAGMLRFGDAHVNRVPLTGDAGLASALAVLERVQGTGSQHDAHAAVTIERHCTYRYTR